MKFKVITLGCKVNIFESESVASDLQKHGYVRVAEDIADIYIINTCTVTNKSDSKSRKLIRQCIKKNSEAIIVVMGCYAQISSGEISTIDGVDIIVGNDQKANVYELIANYQKLNRQVVAVSDIMKLKQMVDLSVESFYENTRAFLKIQDGCNNFCSFCIIPFARGLMRSKTKEQVLSEANLLVANGYYEIVLTGIHTGGYGSDLVNYNITNLIEDLIKIDGLKRLRISSIEINQVSDELLALMKSSPKIARHLHIPIQSANDRVLRSMRRKYSVCEFSNRISYIRSLIPNISITTDLIVGYPTETNQEFLNTYENCKLINFSEIHVFPYSLRNGTTAAKLTQVQDLVKKQRVTAMLQLNIDLKTAYYNNSLGIDETMIIEKVTADYVYGKTSNYLDVVVANNNYQVGDFLEISLLTHEDNKILGQVKS